MRPKVQEKALSPRQGAVTSAGPSCPCFQAQFSGAIFPGKTGTEVLGRGTLESTYLTLGFPPISGAEIRRPEITTF